MILRKWDELPSELQIPEVKKYYEVLNSHKGSLFLKRVFDFIAAFLILLVLSPVFLILFIMIKLDSKGPVFFRQERVTQYGRHFRIYKFRTMVENAEAVGSQITVNHDKRITKVGAFIRGCRLDEIPQLLNILAGDMSFVGTRPEVPKYVKCYTPEMMATLLLPAGVTSLASIKYKDEADLLAQADDLDQTYVQQVLPGKMNYNLEAIEKFCFWKEIILMFQTVTAVIS